MIFKFLNIQYPKLGRNPAVAIRYSITHPNTNKIKFSSKNHVLFFKKINVHGNVHGKACTI